MIPIKFGPETNQDHEIKFYSFGPKEVASTFGDFSQLPIRFRDRNESHII